ncbi:MAG TPA: restriction endonuclease [Ignavibacteriales bacterium]|nr:restriction endonuclease [Ignavibacteriales bacterium]
MNRVTKLKDISSTIGSGITPSRSNKNFWIGGTIPWLKTGQLGEHKIYDTNEKITKYALANTGIKIFPVNTLSIALYGEGKTRGNVSILKSEMTTNQACCNIVIDKTKADYEFIYYLLKTKYNQLRNLSSGIRKNLNADYIKELEINLPSKITVQQKIATVLSSLDSKIEFNNRINAELEAMSKTLYDYWFVQFDFPNANGKPYKSSGGKMLWNEELKRDIPDGWGVKKMSEWIDIDKSGDWGREEHEGKFTKKVTCIRGADINGLNGLEELKPPVRYILQKNSFKILKSHDLIIEISGGSPTQSTGRLAYITDATLKRFNNPVICSNFCKAISIKDKKMLYNLIYYWNSLYDSGAFFGYEGKTTGIKNLLFDSFVNSYWTVVPPDTLVDKFYKVMTTIQDKKQVALSENQKLAELRDWLLPMLMNGQVKVK